MEPRFRNNLVLLVVLVIGLATAAAVYFGGAGGIGRRDPNRPPEGPIAQGVVVNVQSEGLTDVVSFTLRTTTGANVVFLVDALENDAEFPPGHLVEHQASSMPIQVWYRTQDGVNHALWLADAEQTG